MTNPNPPPTGWGFGFKLHFKSFNHSGLKYFRPLFDVVTVKAEGQADYDLRVDDAQVRRRGNDVERGAALGYEALPGGACGGTFYECEKGVCSHFAQLNWIPQIHVRSWQAGAHNFHHLAGQTESRYQNVATYPLNILGCGKDTDCGRRYDNFKIGEGCQEA